MNMFCRLDDHKFPCPVRYSVDCVKSILMNRCRLFPGKRNINIISKHFCGSGRKGEGGSRKKKKDLHIISLGILHFPNYSIITMFSFIGEIIFTFVELPINCKEIHFFQNHMGYSKYLQVCILF